MSKGVMEGAGTMREVLLPTLFDVPVKEATPVLSRARGCLLGQLAGDSLGGLVEFKGRDEIRRLYPQGVRELADGGTWGTLAGQATDDSEMALMLARSIVGAGRYDERAAASAYAWWFASGPFDVGGTTRRALAPAAEALRDGGDPAAVARAAAHCGSMGSQANGALMRVSPLGVFGHALRADDLAEQARADAALTHPHPVCRDASAVFAVAVALAIRTGAGPEEVYAAADDFATNADLHADVRKAIRDAGEGPPDDFERNMGWVLIALRNTLGQLLHARTLEDGVVDTVMRGGDTDTNAAIAGALLGAVHGEAAIPEQWRRAILNCRPERGRPGVRQPRPREFWPIDVPQLADALVDAGAKAAAAAGAP